jgi:hypothetical protein
VAVVHVIAETPVFGLRWRQEAELERTPLVDAAIEAGRLTVVGKAGSPSGPSKAEVDAALEAAGLSTAGSLADKRARLQAHQAGADT